MLRPFTGRAYDSVGLVPRVCRQLPVRDHRVFSGIFISTLHETANTAQQKQPTTMPTLYRALLFGTACPDLAPIYLPDS